MLEKDCSTITGPLLAERIDALEKLIDEKFKSRDLAINKALSANDDRLTTMNEFRGQMADERNNYATKDVIAAQFEGYRKEFSAKFDSIMTKMAIMEDSIAASRGAKTQSRDTTQTYIWVVPLITSAIAIVMGILALVHL